MSREIGMVEKRGKKRDYDDVAGGAGQHEVQSKNQSRGQNGWLSKPNSGLGSKSLLVVPTMPRAMKKQRVDLTGKVRDIRRQLPTP